MLEIIIINDYTITVVRGSNIIDWGVPINACGHSSILLSVDKSMTLSTYFGIIIMFIHAYDHRFSTQFLTILFTNHNSVLSRKTSGQCSYLELIYRLSRYMVQSLLDWFK